MNLPNKLTIARTALTPFFIAALLIPFDNHWLWSCLIFSAASLTDMLDGRIARSQGIVTTFGKFLDPLADKILVTSAFIGLAALGLAHPVVAIIAVVRDYVVSAVRMLAASGEGKIIAANIWGKIKTALSMIIIVGVQAAMFFAEKLGGRAVEIVSQCSNVAMWILAVITALSGIVYVVQNKSLFGEFK
ncbi:MAG: CDP-diacylglycerol--glycerol-3-phosphate 3-phosphatidyltransferase [Oscillospiraceae bacterium]